MRKESGALSESRIGLVPSWANALDSIALAVVDETGKLVDSNQGFLALFAQGEAAMLAKPDMASLRAAEKSADGLVYAGAIVLSTSRGDWEGLPGKIYRIGSQLLIAAEPAASAYRQLNAEVGRLSRELEEAQRNLNRRNQALQTALESIEVLKRQDTLTGLANRQSLDERISQEISRWERYRRPLGLILMEMDDFGGVNEGYGREAGDELLRHVATILNQTIRGTDMVARYGGLEFAVLLPETNEMGSLIVAERLRMELESQIILPMVRPLTASFGVAMLLPGEERQEFCARAGRAVGYSKKNGRNCVTMAGVISECDQLYQVAKNQGTDNV